MDIKELIQLVSQVTLILMVASIGLRAHWRDVVAAGHDLGLLLRSVVAVNIVVPLVAILMCMALPIPQPVRIGIAIIAVSPLAPLATGKMVRCGLDASRVVGLYVSLVLLSVIIVPATIALLSRLFPVDAAISVGAVTRLVGVTVLAPLAAGLAIGSFAPDLAKRAAGPLLIGGYVVLGIIFVPVAYSQAADLAGLFGNGTVVAMAVIAAAGLAAGHLLGGPDPSTRTALALAAATRHPGIAALIAVSNFGGDRRVTLATLLFVAVSVVMSTLYQLWVKRQVRKATPSALAA